VPDATLPVFLVGIKLSFINPFFLIGIGPLTGSYPKSNLSKVSSPFLIFGPTKGILPSVALEPFITGPATQ
jgi:hypothetical protein